MLQLSPRGSRFVKDFGIKLPSVLVQRHYPEFVNSQIALVDRVLVDAGGSLEEQIVTDLKAVKDAWQGILKAMPKPQMHFMTFVRDQEIRDPEQTPAYSIEDAQFRISDIESAIVLLNSNSFTEQYSDDSLRYAQRRLGGWIRILKDQIARYNMEFTVESRKGRPADQVAKLAAKRAKDAELRASMRSSKKK